MDFLISVPDGNSTVIEIDGVNMTHKAETTTAEMRILRPVASERSDPDRRTCAWTRPNLSLVENLADSLPVDSRQIPIDNLVWVPILLHRLGFALGEALSRQFSCRRKVGGLSRRSDAQARRPAWSLPSRCFGRSTAFGGKQR